MPSYTPRSGFTGTATINGTELPVTDWSVSPSATILQFMNSLTGKHARKSATFEDASFSISFDWDDSNNPFASPLTITQGATITNVKLLLDGPTGALYWSFPSAIVSGTPQSLQRAGKITTTLNCTADGTFAAPGGTLD